MIIKELTLYTHALESEKKFYKDVLGFGLIENKPDKFSVRVGLSKLKFCRSDIKRIYHYCFLIPSNQLTAAIDWLQNRLSVIKIEDERVVQRFETWNADSVYFLDGSGNIAEFIVRYDLKNDSQSAFDLSSIISVNEIGVPTNDVNGLNEQLKQELKTELWKGDLKRFGTNGDQNGLFLLPNYEVKKTWFPTELEVQPSDFNAIVENAGIEYIVEYKGGKLKTEVSYPPAHG